MLLNKIHKALLFVDQFGQTPQFLIKKDIQYHSIFGGLMTILVYIIGLIALIFFSQEIFNKNSPSVNLATQNDGHPSKIDYFDNFEFLIGIQNQQYVVEINDKFFTAEGFLFQTVVNDSGTFNIRHTIDLEPCSEALKYSPNYNLFQNLNLEGYYCISRNQSKFNDKDIFIRDFWGSDGFQMLQIKFYDCKNSSTSQNCAPQEEIDKYLGLTEVSLFTVDNLVKTRDYKHPYERTVKEKFYYVSNNFQVSITEYLKHLTIISDDGLLFTTNKTIDMFQHDYLMDYTIYQRDSKTFVSFTVQLNNIREVYYRKYYKLQDLAAQVGGIFKTLLIIFYVITKFHSEHSYYEHLIKHFYDIKVDSDEKGKGIKHIKEVASKPGENQKTDGNLKRKKKLKKNKNSIKLSFFDKLFFLSFFPKYSNAKRRKIEQIYFKGRDKLFYYLEIDHVLQKFHNQETLYNILFTENQKKVCNYVFKPIINNNTIGMRYSSNEVSSKIKQKLIGCEPWFSNRIMEKIMEQKESDNKIKGNKKSKLDSDAQLIDCVDSSKKETEN